MTASPGLLKEAREWLDKRPILRNGEKRELAFAEFAALKIREAAPYMKHQHECDVYWEADRPCNCGLDELLRRFGLDQEAKP